MHELDNRGSTFYLALYWAQALAAQDQDKALQARFAEVAQALAENEAVITEELLAVQGEPVDIGGYYHPDAYANRAGDAPKRGLQRRHRRHVSGGRSEVQRWDRPCP